MNTLKKFIISSIIGIALVFIISSVFLHVGAEKVPFDTVFNSIFRFDEDNFSHIIIREMRMPRLLADIIVGSSLAVAGAIMQGTTKNPLADSGIMGISSGSMFAVVLIVLYVPNVTRLGRIGISSLGAFGVTALIYAIAVAGKKRATSERMVLSGMAISTLFSSITTALILQKGISSQMMRYTTGSSAQAIWNDVYICLPFFVIAIVVSFLISRSLTIMNLGEEVSKGLGANTTVISIISTLVVLILSALAVVIIGPVGYVGLMIPHICRKMVGTDYKKLLPLCCLYGAVMVVGADLLARVILAPLEFPIGLLLTMIGVPFFIYSSRHQNLEQQF